jgi:hypothetical protein
VSGGAMTEYVFEQPNPVPDYWNFSDIELARCCLLVAESRSGLRNALLRGEALRVFLMWREAINARRMRGEAREDRVALLWSLRKRTIQILVRLSLQGLLFIPWDR